VGPPTSGVPEIDVFLANFRVVVLRGGLVTVEGLRRELGFGDKNRVTYDLGRRLISRRDVARYLAASRTIAGAEPDARAMTELYRLHDAACAAAEQRGVSVHESRQSRLDQEEQQNREVRAELDQAERDQTALREALAAARSTTVKSEQLIAQLKELLQEVTDQLRESRRTVAALTNQKNALLTRVNRLSAENRALRASLAELRTKPRSQRPVNARFGLIRLPGELSLLFAALTIGLFTAALSDIQLHTVWTHPTVTAILIVLTYLGARGVDLSELRGGGVALVTSLVLAKTVLIASVVFLVFLNSSYLALAMAVAQIAPSSYAMLLMRSNSNLRSRHLVHVWAAIDGPISTLLTVYSAPLLARGDGSAALAIDLVTNVIFAMAVFVMHRAVRMLGMLRGANSRLANLVTWNVLLLCLAIGTWQSLVLGIALVGLFLRPVPNGVSNHAERSILAVTALLAGLTLADGINVAAGVLLGVAAYLAQMLVAIPIREPRFGLAHRTSSDVLVLALVLEPLLPGSVATLIPALLVTTGLHRATNRIFDLTNRSTSTTMSPALTNPLLPDAKSRVAA
jgi:hypothetical protein